MTADKNDMIIRLAFSAECHKTTAYRCFADCFADLGKFGPDGELDPKVPLEEMAFEDWACFWAYLNNMSIAIEMAFRLLLTINDMIPKDGGHDLSKLFKQVREVDKGHLQAKIVTKLEERLNGLDEVEISISIGDLSDHFKKNANLYSETKYFGMLSKGRINPNAGSLTSGFGVSIWACLYDVLWKMCRNKMNYMDIPELDEVVKRLAFVPRSKAGDRYKPSSLESKGENSSP